MLDQMQTPKSNQSSSPKPRKSFSPINLLQKILALILSDHGFVLIAVTVSSGFSFLSNLAMAKVLTISQYGVYVSCIALFSFITILATSVQSTTANLVAQKAAEKGDKAVWRTLGISLAGLFTCSIVLFVILLPFTPLLASFMKVEVNLIVYVLLGTLLFAPFALSLGGLQGLQHFRLFGIAMIGGQVGRLALGILLVVAGFGLAGAVLSIPLAMLGTITLNIILLTWVYRRQKKTAQNTSSLADNTATGQLLGTFFATGSFAMLGTLGFTFLTTIDVILVQSYFAGNESGHYAAIATLGKIVFYFTGPIGLVLLPKVAQAVAKGQNSLPMLRRSLLATFGLGFLALVGLAVGGGFVVKFFASDFPMEQAWLIALHGGAMLLYGLVNIWVQFFIGVKARLYLSLVVPALCLQIGLIIIWHTSLTQVILMLYVAGILLYLIAELCFWLYQKKLTKAFITSY